MPRLSTAEFLIFAFAFIYIGVIAIPGGWVGWTAPFFLWIIVFSFLALIVLISGITGAIGLLISLVKKTPFRRAHKFLVALTIFCALWSLIAFQIAGANRFVYEHRTFDSAIWKSNATQEINLFSSLSLRRQMVNDLTTNVLPNRTKQEVKNLLGFPDRISSSEGAATFLYVLGPEKGWDIDSECVQCLLIMFNSSDTFERYNTYSLCG